MVRAVTPIPFVKARFFDRCGKPLTGGKVYTYEANTTTPKVTYKDPYGLTPNTNPIILDAAGEADIYLDGTYRIRITDRNDVLVNDVAKIGSWFSDNLQDTLDNISGAMDDALKPILQNLDAAINAAAAAGAGANGWTANLVTDGTRTQKTINDLSMTKKLVDTRLYGVVANTSADQTAAIHAAFADNPQNNAFYIPSGVIHANIVFPRASMAIVGDGMQNTFIRPFDLSKPAVDFNTKLYPSLQELTTQAGQDYTADCLIDAKDVRYMYLLNMAARKTVKAGEQHQYKTILIDNRAVNETWTGYNRLHGVYATYGAYGYLTDVTKLNSDLSIKDGAYNSNGYFNIKTAMSNSIISNCEIADGGKLQPQNTYDETKYGGIYAAGDNSVIYAIWHEYNSAVQPSHSPNNVYIEPTAYNITHNYGRDSRSLQNVRIYSKSQGELQNVNTADTAINDGQGRSRPNQLIKNGCFRYWDTLTNKPMGWGTYYAGTWSQELSDLPKGFNTGFKLLSGDIAGAIGVYQTIFDAADLTNSMIKNIALWAGREISMSFWLKNLGSSSSVVRVGISVNEGSIYLSNGNFVAETKIGEWTKYVINYKIVGNETKIAIGARMAGANQGMIVTGFSVADDCKVNDFQAKPITEDGGEIYGALEIKGIITKNGLEFLNKPSAVYAENLSSINDPINKIGKFAGRQIFNNSDSKMYYTVGSEPASAWKSFDSVNVITPA